MTESTTIKESPFDIRAVFSVKSKKFTLNAEFDADVSREYIKGLNVDKVKGAVSLKRPYISEFFTAVLDRNYEDVIDVLYPIAAMYNGPYANNSPVVKEFSSVLSLGDTYFEAVNKFLGFYINVEGDSTIVLNKVKAIYDRFKDNRAKVLDGLFVAYEAYLNSLSDGEESARSRKAKNALYAEYVRNQNKIESVLDEVASISPKKTEDSPLKNITGKNYDVVRAFFEENRTEMKKISAKLLYLAYLDGILRDEQGSIYSTNKHSKFTKPSNKNELSEALKSEIGSKISEEFQVSLSNTGFTLTIPTISSVDVESAINAVAGIDENGTVKLSFVNMNSEIKNLPQYAFYYAYDEVFGSKNLIHHAAKLLDIESVKNAASILVNQPMPDDFDLGEYSFSVEGASVVSKEIRLSDKDLAVKYVKVFAILKDFSLEEYEEEVSSIVKRLSKNPEALYSTEDVLKRLRHNKLESFNLLTYGVLKAALKNPEHEADVADLLAYVAYDCAVNDNAVNKLFIQLFKKVLSKYQGEIVTAMIRKTKGDEYKLEKVKEFLSSFESILDDDSKNQIGVVSNVEE